MFGAEKKSTAKMEDDRELELLLNEIPVATSNHYHDLLHDRHHDGGDHVSGSFLAHTFCDMSALCDDNDPPSCHKHNCASPLSGFSLQSDGSSSSLFSNENSLSDHGSPTPPPLEDHDRSSMPCGGAKYYPTTVIAELPDSPMARCVNGSSTDESALCRHISKMYISNGHECAYVLGDVSTNSSQLQDRINREKHGGGFDNWRGGFSHHVGAANSTLSVGSNCCLPQQENGVSNSLGSQFYPCGLNNMFSHQTSSSCIGSMGSPWKRTKEQACSYPQGLLPLSASTAYVNKFFRNDGVCCGQQNGTNSKEERHLPNYIDYFRRLHVNPHPSISGEYDAGMMASNGRSRLHSNPRMLDGALESLTKEDSFILQGECLNYVANKRFGHLRRQNKSGTRENGLSKHLERTRLDSQSQVAGTCGNTKFNSHFFPLPKYNSLAEARGYVYLLARDQHGCRFLQRLFDEGSQQDVQIIFTEIIDHVVELMMNPFGNYLMQKLLEVCSEEQRMLILLMITEEPAQLVRISLNTHGTRVVQKLIETLRTRQQISLVIKALEPGFLSLIKDLNGNHVIQRCLQCLSSEDNQFIFVAATKYCVDIATHQHGCCVLQQCINRSTGKYKENLVAEISSNGLLLAQDAYGNYVVQFILELKIPFATSSLISQFKGKYVHLSTQKFSSHVVEKCVAVFDEEKRSEIIREFVSASHFEQLLQDPHGNYVVQTALRFSEGSVHNSLVEAIESHKAASRNNPYSKRIFSQKLLKK